MHEFGKGVIFVVWLGWFVYLYIRSHQSYFLGMVMTYLLCSLIWIVDYAMIDALEAIKLLSFFILLIGNVISLSLGLRKIKDEKGHQLPHITVKDMVVLLIFLGLFAFIIFKV